jgi:segregation and condensation protein A
MSADEKKVIGKQTFEEDSGDALPRGDGLVLDLEGYEGPIDVLLQLARDQKVDLTRISILALANQYLEFVQAARKVRLELAADYLVMAAWLAYLKSRLMLPEPAGDDEPSGAEMAAALKFQLQRLEAMQNAGKLLMERPRLGQGFYARGEPEQLRVETITTFDVTLLELLRAYARNRVRNEVSSLHIGVTELYTVDEALHRLTTLLGGTSNWKTLSSFLPDALKEPLMRRSAIATTFVASLELCREGKLQIRQDGMYGTIYLRGVAEDTRDRS